MSQAWADTMPVSEAAAFLGVPEAQLIRWAQQGVGPKFEGHALRPDRMQYGMDELLDWKADVARRADIHHEFFDDLEGSL